ncbi:MAG TPA: glycosyltransferase, partial [Candidatus Sulfotelmatobacter sp.]|nr:glycosyltransferase [Candidatus Sulfotelmatobacter sp.]
IHAHTAYPDGAAAATMARSLGVPLLITEHASFVARLVAVPEIRDAYVAAGRQASRLIVVSALLADELRASLPELAERIVVVPNAVPVDGFRAAPLAERMPDQLLFVGYRLEAKGIEVLLRAFATVRQRRPAATLRLIGGTTDAALDARWQALAGTLGIGGAVSFEGPAARPQIAEAMAQASVFVHPSRRETFGIVAVEALASGTPVVATASGGLDEILAPDPSAVGGLVPVGDADALATAILRTLERRAAFDPLQLRATVVGRYAAPAVAARLLELYDEALGADGRGGSTGASTRGVAPAPSAAARPSGAPRPSAARGAATTRPVRVVVALDPDRARQVVELGERVRSRIVLVTTPGAWSQGAARPGDVVLADMRGRVQATADARALGPRGTGWRRLVRVLRNPLAVARRRGLLPGLERLVLTRGKAAVDEALARAARLEPAGPTRLVCLDGVDYLAAGPALAEGRTRLEPGGVMWLGDQAAGPATLDPGDSTTEDRDT